MKKLCRMFESEADTARMVEVVDGDKPWMGLASTYVHEHVAATMGSVTYVEVPADGELWRVVCLAPNLYMSDLCTAEEARREIAASARVSSALDVVVDVVEAFTAGVREAIRDEKNEGK